MKGSGSTRLTGPLTLSPTSLFSLLSKAPWTLTGCHSAAVTDRGTGVCHMYPKPRYLLLVLPAPPPLVTAKVLSQVPDAHELHVSLGTGVDVVYRPQRNTAVKPYSIKSSQGGRNLD